MGKILGKKLTPKVIELINAEGSLPTVATIDKNNTPHISFVTLTIATDEETLRLGLYNKGQTIQNVLENGNICIGIVGEGNIAISISGKGKQIGEFPGFAIIELKIKEIQSKRSPYIATLKGVDYHKYDKKQIELCFKQLQEN